MPKRTTYQKKPKSLFRNGWWYSVVQRDAHKIDYDKEEEFLWVCPVCKLVWEFGQATFKESKETSGKAIFNKHVLYKYRDFPSIGKPAVLCPECEKIHESIEKEDTYEEFNTDDRQFESQTETGK